MIDTSFLTSMPPGLRLSTSAAPAKPFAPATPMPTLDARFVDRPMTEADIPAVTAMERLACLHPLHAWSEDNYRSSMRAGYWVRVRSDANGGAIAAVCVAMDGVDEVHLLNIAVAQPFQGQGMARELLQVLYQRCHQRQAPILWLEVRPSNEPARGLYTREGFVQVGVRKNYYPAVAGREDALVMKRDITAPNPAPNGAPHALD